jgi:outer membrane protein assembly factor BamB
MAATACSATSSGGDAAVIPPSIGTLPEVGDAAESGPEPAAPQGASAATSTSTTAPSTTVPPRSPGSVPGWTVGRPWGSVDGLVMFRGNPTRTFYGTGPLLERPQQQWRFPEAAMCGNSPVGGEDKVWCGSGWTGQPVVWNRPDGVTEVIFGAYDKHIHFLDAATGQRTRPDFPMGDIIKGSVSLDPDGYPLLYAGSRDPNFRIIALDRAEPTELWSLPATAVSGMWNNDWDSNAVVVDDVLFVGGENSWWFAVALNRDRDEQGLVTVEPEVVFATPAFTDELVAAVGRQQSVENSTAVYGTTAYFANSAGRVVGVDVARVREGEASVVFDYWVGDDVDASIVIDEEGMLYVASQLDLRTNRGAEVGQLVKLDPTDPDDPRVWGIDVPSTGGADGGIWATPALVGDVLFAVTNPGELLAVEVATGEVLWRDDVGPNAWSSPVSVDDTLVVAVDCGSEPKLRAYDVADPRRPVATWEVAVGSGCIESTPAVWEGRLYVGSRDGFFYALGE